MFIFKITNCNGEKYTYKKYQKNISKYFILTSYKIYFINLKIR